MHMYPILISKYRKLHMDICFFWDIHIIYQFKKIFILTPNIYG